MRRTGEVQSPLEKFFWHRIVCDESHTLKGTKTSISSTCCMLASRNRWCVTGTPYTLSSEDIYGQLAFLGVKTGKSASKFKLKYELGSKLLFNLCSQVMMRHSKTQKRDGEQLLKLGDMVERDLECPMTKSENKHYQKLFATARTKFDTYIVGGVLNSKPFEIYG